MDTTVRHEKEFGTDHGLIHQVVVTGRKVGADEQFWGKLAHNEDLFRNVVSLVNGDITPYGLPDPPAAPTTTLAEAAEIMGSNFHDPRKWAKAAGYRLSKKNQEVFSSVPFSAALLQLLAKTHILVPVLPLSIMQLHGRHTALFYHKDGAWYSAEGFATEKAEACWMLFRREVVPGSTNRSWTDQQALIPEGEHVPTAAQQVQALICHAVLTEERLLPGVYARTSSVGSDGSHVLVGYFFLALGLGVGSWDDGPFGDVGLVSARKCELTLAA